VVSVTASHQSGPGSNPTASETFFLKISKSNALHWVGSKLKKNHINDVTSTHKGSTAFWHLSWIAIPWEKSITSSSVPWMTSTGDVTLDTLSILGIEIKIINNFLTTILSKIPRESIETPGALRLGESYPHTWHQCRMKNDSTDFVSNPNQFNQDYSHFWQE